jgi:hypothetical protein
MRSRNYVARRMTSPTRQPRVVDFDRGECPPLGGETGGERPREARVHLCSSVGMINGVDPEGGLAPSILVRPDPPGDLAPEASIFTPDPEGGLAPSILVRPDPKDDLARILFPPDPQGGFSPPETTRRKTLGGRHRGLRPFGDHVDRPGGVRDREHAGHAGFAGRRPTSGRLPHGRHPGSRPLHRSEHAERVGRPPGCRFNFR